QVHHILVREVLGDPLRHPTSAIGQTVARQAAVEEAVRIVHLTVAHKMHTCLTHGRSLAKVPGQPDQGCAVEHRQRIPAQPGGFSAIFSPTRSKPAPIAASSAGVTTSTSRARTDPTCTAAAATSVAYPSSVMAQSMPR